MLSNRSLFVTGKMALLICGATLALSLPVHAAKPAPVKRSLQEHLEIQLRRFKARAAVVTIAGATLCSGACPAMAEPAKQAPPPKPRPVLNPGWEIRKYYPTPYGAPVYEVKPTPVKREPSQGGYG
jgi:hypothetical protein